MEYLEIVTAVLAVFGLYTLLDMLRVRLLYPKRVRCRLRGAVFSDDVDIESVAAYARYLRLEQKISKERLIILLKDDIINLNENPAQAGEFYDIIYCKDLTDDG